MNDWRAGKSNELILVGAHYDSVESSPGANDNGTGVAAMLEISRVFAGVPAEAVAKAGGSAGASPSRTLRFVAFVNEEPPYFETEQQGSRVYAKLAHARGDDIRAMMCLETMGYYSDAPGSQQYPKPFNLFYPDRGNFIGFVSNLRSRGVLRRDMASCSTPREGSSGGGRRSKAIRSSSF